MKATILDTHQSIKFEFKNNMCKKFNFQLRITINKQVLILQNSKYYKALKMTFRFILLSIIKYYFYINALIIIVLQIICQFQVPKINQIKTKHASIKIYIQIIRLTFFIHNKLEYSNTKNSAFTIDEEYLLSNDYNHIFIQIWHNEKKNVLKR